MSNIDKQALRNLALRATQGPWSMEHENIWYYENGYTKHLAYFCQGDDVDDHQDDANTRYVAAADPTTVLALLDELEAKDKRIAELSQKADIYDMLRQDYGLQGSLVDFVDWQAKRITELEAREVKLPELKMLRDYLAEVTMREREDILVGVRLEFFRALEEAGVKVVAAAGKGE